jgi:hypothetical protein
VTLKSDQSDATSPMSRFQVPSSVLGTELQGAGADPVPVKITFAPPALATLTSSDTIQFESDVGGTAKLGVRGPAVAVGTLSCVSTDVPNGDFGNMVRGNPKDLHAVCTVSGGYAQMVSLALTLDTSTEFELIPPTTQGPTGLLPPGDDSITFSVRFIATGYAAPHTGTVQLTLSTGTVISFPLQAAVVAPPPSQLDIDVVMTEVQVPPDLDLHFTRAGANGPFDHENAVWWQLRAPKWGPNDLNNPFLDRDSIDGTLPEELTLEQVPNEIGDYDVYVHYYGVPIQYAGLAATSTVTIRLNYDTTPAALFTRTLQCGDMWHVAHLHFGGAGTGVATPVNSVVPDTFDAMCPP